MDEETKDQTTQQQEDQQTGEGEQNSAGRGMTFDEWLDSDPALRSEFDRRNTKAVQTARSKWEQEQADNQDEAKKLERMTAAQREKYQLEKDRQTLEQERADPPAGSMCRTLRGQVPAQKRLLMQRFAVWRLWWALTRSRH